jgi:PleD family two-component response regulator
LLEELYRKIHGLTGSAGVVGFSDMAQIAAVFEVLLKELIEQPKAANESTLRTMHSSVELIGDLFKNSPARKQEHRPVKLLIVDDECLSRRAIVYALKKAHLDFVSEDVEDPDVAFRMANEKTFDLIFLDIQMPSMNGFDLCSKIRAGVSNASTPIIFVTSLADFKSRAKSTLCGGSELIAKPFLFVELALKVIALLIRNRTWGLSKAA